MTHREVVILHVVLDHVLPVDRHVVGPGLVERDHLVEPVVRKLADVRGHALGDRGLPAPEAHEQETHEVLELDRLQAVLRAVELRESIRRADAAVTAVEVVRPAVVHAGQVLCTAAALAGNDRVRAMGADVVEGADDAVLAAHDEAAAAEELECPVVAGLRQLALVADDLPGRQEQLLAFELVELLAVVDPGRQGQLDRGVGRDRRFRRFLARGRGGFDTRRQPGKHAAQVGAALAARSLAVEGLALEEDALPLLVDQAHQAVGDGFGIRPGRTIAARGDELLAEVYDHPAPGGITVAANALVIAARLALGQEGVPDGDLGRVG